jgi:hypothetical protein
MMNIELKVHVVLLIIFRWPLDLSSALGAKMRIDMIKHQGPSVHTHPKKFEAFQGINWSGMVSSFSPIPAFKD